MSDSLGSPGGNDQLDEGVALMDVPADLNAELDLFDSDAPTDITGAEIEKIFPTLETATQIEYVEQCIASGEALESFLTSLVEDYAQMRDVRGEAEAERFWHATVCSFPRLDDEAQKLLALDMYNKRSAWREKALQIPEARERVLRLYDEIANAESGALALALMKGVGSAQIGDNKEFLQGVLPTVEDDLRSGNVESAIALLESHPTYKVSEPHMRTILRNVQEHDRPERGGAAASFDRQFEDLHAQDIEWEKSRLWLALVNLRLPYFAARRFKQRTDVDTPLLDLAQAGNCGLLRGIDMHNPHHRSQASVGTYAYYWIMQQVHEATRLEDRAIKLTVNRTEDVIEFRRTVENLMKQHGTSNPTVDQIGAELGEDSVLSLHNLQLDSQRLDTLDREVRVKGTPVEGRMVRDDLVDTSADDPAVGASQEMLRSRINKVLKELTYREREIIKLRYGLGDGYSYTLEEVGNIFKVSRDRIREIEARAVKKLNEPNVGPSMLDAAKESLE